MGSTYSHMFHPEVTPFEFTESQFDPMFGFEETGRKPRPAPPVTAAELESAHIKMEDRDYCTRELIEYKACRYRNFPVFSRCKHEMHAYGWCRYDDYLIRMKEYERERRLMERAQRVGPERAGYRVATAS